MSINELQDKIVKDFNQLEDWLDRYNYLIRLGKNLIPMKEEYKTQENVVFGCQNRVWVAAELNEGKICYYVDSDTLITKGLIALLLQVLDQQTPQAIMAAELKFIDDIGLKSNLSPSRANGLSAIIQQMKKHAENL